MSGKKINVAIAEFCGWKDVHWWDGDNSGPGGWYGIPSLTEEEVFTLPKEKLNALRNYGAEIPNYFGDLNAITDAIRCLKGAQKYELTEHLSDILGLDGIGIWNYGEAFKLISATAHQRCEALLRTIGKWESE